MKKKFTWIAVLFAALALVITGCPGEGDEPPPPPITGGDLAATNVYFAKDEGEAGFSKYQDADAPFVIPTNDFYVRILFDPIGEDYSTLRVYFTLSAARAVVEQCVFEGEEYTYRGSHDGLGEFDSFEWEKNPAEIFEGLVDKTAIRGICFHVENGGGVTFTLNEIKFMGGTASSPGVAPEDDDWYLATAEGGALKAVDNTLTFTGTGTKSAYIYFKPNTGTYSKLKIDFTLSPGQDISWQAVYDDTGTWGNNSGQGYIDWKEAGPIETDLAIFVDKWGATGDVLNKATLKGACLGISLGDTETSATFTLTGVTFE